MSEQPLQKEVDRNPRTPEDARKLVQHVESLFMPWNIDALVDGFTDDCVVRFGTLCRSFAARRRCERSSPLAARSRKAIA
jgi:hypothetical protein